jgi:ABC-type transporter MlaC component
MGDKRFNMKEQIYINRRSACIIVGVSEGSGNLYELLANLVFRNIFLQYLTTYVLGKFYKKLLGVQRTSKQPAITSLL